MHNVQFWDMLRAANIPFRFHWAKYVPAYDFKNWAKYYKENLPKFAEFLSVRKKRDPDNVFLTDYWKDRLYGE